MRDLMTSTQWECAHHGSSSRRRRASPFLAKAPRSVSTQRPERKIDSPVVLMMAVGRAIAADGGEPDISDLVRAPLFA